MAPRFLQIHTLTSYPAALLNRDDAGSAKRLPFGGAVRTRISSQCLKRHWRRAGGPHALTSIQDGDGPVPMAVRSRRTFDQEIFGKLKDDGVDEALAFAVTEALIKAVLGESAAKKAKKDATDGETAKTEQVTVLGRPEVKFFLKSAREAVAEHDDPKDAAKAIEAQFKKEGKKNLDALRHGAGLDAALFGRMVTSDILARTDAAIHVAHAFTVHREDAEDDYFTAVDDLRSDDGELGSGHINSTELTSGLYYGYVVVDVPLLVSNLEGCAQDAWDSADRSLAAEVVRRLIPLIATTSPGAKLGSTAPYSHAHMVLVEAGDEAPRSLASAFMEPVAQGGKTVSNTYTALAEHLGEFDQAYGRPARGRHALALGEKALLAPVVDDFMNLQELSTWAAERVIG